jgi:hypothetical protein
MASEPQLDPPRRPLARELHERGRERGLVCTVGQQHARALRAQPLRHPEPAAEPAEAHHRHACTVERPWECLHVASLHRRRASCAPHRVHRVGVIEGDAGSGASSPIRSSA